MNEILSFVFFKIKPNTYKIIDISVGNYGKLQDVLLCNYTENFSAFTWWDDSNNTPDMTNNYNMGPSTRSEVSKNWLYLLVLGAMDIYHIFVQTQIRWFLFPITPVMTTESISLKCI